MVLAQAATTEVVEEKQRPDELYLVTGACGFVGSHMVDLLQEQGRRVRATDLATADRRYVDSLGVEFVPGDVTKPESLDPAFEGVTRVLSPAALFSFSAPFPLLHRVNVMGTKNVLDACLRNPSVRHAVIWSSGVVYGKPDSVPVMEEFPLRPRSPYEKSKAEQDELVRTYIDDFGAPATLIRPAATYGPRSRFGAAVPVFLMALGQLPAIPGRGDVYGATVHVCDVVRAALHLVDRDESIGQVYNVADDTLVTVEDVMKQLAPHVGAKLYDVHLPMWGLKALSWWSRRRTKGGVPPKIEQDAFSMLLYDTFMSNRKLKGTGFQLHYPNFVVGMVETIEWYKAHNWLWRDEFYKERMHL